MEAWHTGKWVNEIVLDDLSPMWENWEESGYFHFYIKELVQLVDGKYVIPLWWIMQGGIEKVEVHEVVYDTSVSIIHAISDKTNFKN